MFNDLSAGEERIYRSRDEGSISGIQSESEIHLKIGAPVILTANLNETLVNGLQGTVLMMHDEYVKILFPDIGEVNVRPFNFTKYDPKLKYDVGSRTQLPLKLCFAITVHKCQGMTLDRLEVDCKGMFEYGQLVVAVSRAVNKKGLRILNFTNKFILRPPESVTTFFRSEILRNYENDLSCCRNSFFDKTPKGSPVDVVDSYDDDNDEDEDNDNQLMLEILESLEQQDISTPLNLEDEFEVSLPAHLNSCNIVSMLIHQNPQTSFKFKKTRHWNFFLVT